MSAPHPLEAQLAELGVAGAIQSGLSGDDDRIVDQYLELAGSRAQSDVDVAAAALEVCAALASGWKRQDLLPKIYYLRARMALNNGRPEEALDLIDRAKHEWMAHGEVLAAHRTDLGKMNVLDDLGSHPEAIRTGNELVANLEQLKRTKVHADPQLLWMRAAAQENLGAAYGYTGQHQKALDAYSTAETEYENIGSPADGARCRANRGVELVAIGQAVGGLEAIAQAAELFADVGDDHSYAKCLGHLADAELLLGRYTDCLDRFNEARLLFERLDAGPEAARLAVKTMRTYLALNLIDEALDIGVSAIHDLTELGLRHDMAEVQWLQAVAYLADSQPDQALLAADEAVIGAGTSGDPVLEIRAQTARSQALSELDRTDEARLAAQTALAMTAQGSWPTEEWAVHLRLSQLADSDRSMHLAMAKRLADELGLPHFQYAVLVELGLLCRRDGDLDRARQYFTQAVAVVEGLRGHIGNETVRTSFLEGRTSAHDQLISLLVASGEPTDGLLAFDIAERCKARTLIDLIEGAPDHFGGTSETRSAADLQADLDACYSALIAGGHGLTRERRRAIQKRATELETRIQRGRLEGDGSHQRFLGRSGDETFNSRPSNDEQVVEYHLSGQQLLAFVWSDGQFNVVSDLPSADQVRELVDAWTRQLERFQLARRLPGDRTVDLVGSADEALRQIWARVFAPVAHHLTATASTRLLVVPHGPLHSIPFHALPSPAGRVGEQWAVSVAPSYTVATSLQRRKTVQDKPGGASLVIGVADEAAPAVASEAIDVAGQLPGSELLLNDDATIDAFFAGCRRRPAVLHLACHGLHRARNPMFSSLKLADGWLTAHDVISADIDGSLVVLSACESGRLNSDRVLNEPVGLARSFVAAGARAVVVSLWLADDAATADLMTDFYRELSHGSEPTVALQKAQAGVAQDTPHPAAWAPFVVHTGAQPEGT